MKQAARRGPPRALEQRSAKDAVGAALKFRGITDEIRAQRLIAEWTDLVGARIASRTLLVLSAIPKVGRWCLSRHSAATAECWALNDQCAL